LTERLPVVSGAQLIGALEKVGWETVRQRGSHVRLRHPERSLFLVVPLHRELKRGTLAGILRDAGLDRDEPGACCNTPKSAAKPFRRVVPVLSRAA
jgi:predicted RNA binding protein YcfA (HicA-like mRNA interferase family)